MKIIVDKSIADLGKKSIVIAIAKNVNPAAKLSDAFLEKQKKMEEWALNCDAEEAAKHPVNQGYIDSISAVGRSTKKNPPTAVALIQNIKRRGSMPNINSIVDIYNVESLHSFLAIGGHDFDKIDEEICFTVSKKEDVFYPILAPEKYVAETDYVYKDKKGIMAWIDVRDGENYKFDENTKNAIFIIQGNANTSVEMRLEALERIRKDMEECMPDMEFSTHVITYGDENTEI
jgi:hypothetical protein